MYGVGMDLLEIDRLERALERRPGLAARFCAKEAVTKALALDVLRPLEIEVVRDERGAPRVRLSGSAAQRVRDLDVVVTISLTHTRATAGAVALAGAPR